MTDTQAPSLNPVFLNAIRNFRPIDDTFMRNLFRNSIETAQVVLRILLNVPDLSVTFLNTQVDLKRITGSRGLCLDVLATDSAGRKYDIEVQRESSDASPLRSRYHASAMDVENLQQGMDFDELPDTYVIFITEKDYFRLNQPVYKIQRIILNSGKPFDDGSYILYVNGEYRDNSDIGRLMHDFCCSNPEDMLIPELAARTKYLKTNEKEIRLMCKQMEEIKREGFKEGESFGFTTGINTRNMELAVKMYNEGNSIEKIASFLDASIEQVNKWISEGK